MRTTLMLSLLLAACTGTGKPAPAVESVIEVEVVTPAVRVERGDDAAEYTCSGGGCNVACSANPGMPLLDGCKATCSGGGCNHVCTAGASCVFTCSGGGCNQSCAEGSSCDLTCSGGGCNRACADATCSKTCSGGGCQG
jgi:hypothetical protein